MQRVYEVSLARQFATGYVYHVVARTAEEAMRKARRQALRDTGQKREWRCKSLSETGTVIL